MKQINRCIKRNTFRIITILLCSCFVFFSLPCHAAVTKETQKDAFVITKDYQNKTVRSPRAFGRNHSVNLYYITYILLTDEDRRKISDAASQKGWDNLFLIPESGKGTVEDIYNILPDREVGRITKDVTEEFYNITQIGSIVKVYPNATYDSVSTDDERKHPVKYIKNFGFACFFAIILILSLILPSNRDKGNKRY